MLLRDFPKSAPIWFFEFSLCAGQSPQKTLTGGLMATRDSSLIFYDVLVTERLMRWHPSE
jgi:hypothetical protein